MFANSELRTRNSEPSRATRGSILVIIMVTLIFTALALTAFIEKAGNDLIVEAREANATRLRQEAYSALHTTLAVLEQFRIASQGLHSPAEGWSDPLGFAAYTPSEGRTVELVLEDESGKISLPQVNASQLQHLFVAWAMSPNDAEKLTDALLGWIKKDHIYASVSPPDYEHSALPYVSPQRSLRSFSELAAIDVARTAFFDENGRPNELHRKFIEAFSLFNFRQTNINGAQPDALTAIGEFDDAQQKLLNDYTAGTGLSARNGPAWFTSAAEAQKYLGTAGHAEAFGATISALRIRLTVHEGRSEFRLNVVVSPQGGGAATVQANATSSAASGPAAKKLNYPFTILEISENEPLARARPK